MLSYIAVVFSSWVFVSVCRLPIRILTNTRKFTWFFSTFHDTFHSFQLIQQRQAEGREISNAKIRIWTNKMHRILVIRLYFLLDALHVSDYISPSSGATFIGCTSLLCGYSHKTAMYVTWYATSIGLVLCAQTDSHMALKFKLACSYRNTQVLLKTIGSDSLRVTAVLGTEPAYSEHCNRPN